MIDYLVVEIYENSLGTKASYNEIYGEDACPNYSVVERSSNISNSYIKLSKSELNQISDILTIYGDDNWVMRTFQEFSDIDDIKRYTVTFGKNIK